MLLEVDNLHVHYGAIHALKGVSIQVEEGEIVTLIGANGAGKTTTLKAISGVLRASEGSIKFRGRAISGLAPHRVVELGVSQVPEGRKVFANLTVRDNLELGAYVRRDRKAVAKDMERVFRLFPRLKERVTQLAGTLSGGEQQMLSTARGLMSNPQLMLMDEPSMGLAPVLVKEIFATIREINDAGTTILLVEQNAHMALSVADKAYVIETGRVVFSGPAVEVAGDEAVRKAYLGG